MEQPPSWRRAYCTFSYDLDGSIEVLDMENNADDMESRMWSSSCLRIPGTRCLRRSWPYSPGSPVAVLAGKNFI